MGVSEDIQIPVPDDMVDLAIGHPDPNLLPVEIVRDAARTALAEGASTVLRYGEQRGGLSFRASLSAFLTDRYDVTVDPDSLLLTAGTSQALELVCNVFTRKGDVVFVEEPTYFLALRIFRDHGLRVRSIATDEAGLRMDALRRALEEETPRFVYAIPAFQNPTGVTLSDERRSELIGLAEAHDFLVLADEAYQLLDHDAPPPPPLASYASRANVLSLGSFSKILAPGVRVGWVQTAPELVEALAGRGMLTSGGGLNPVGAAIVTELLRNGAQRSYLERLRATYAERAGALASAVRSLLPAAKFRPPEGGYFLWAEVPGVDLESWAVTAQAHGVRFTPGPACSVGGGGTQAVRLCFAYYEPVQLREGVTRLARALDGAAQKVR